MSGEKPIVGEKRAFVTGNEVVSWAALAAGAHIMYGYPITPQNEIMHYWTRLAPEFERGFLQTEDEISAGFATLGGVIAGKRAFTATSGPGNMLMQESMCMAEMMRLPAVFVIQQRGGPSTATVIYSQQEVTLTSIGGNGEGFRFVYSTSGHQELFDYTLKAFHDAWTYRFPAFVLGDGYQAKMREPVTMYDPALKGLESVETRQFAGIPGKPGLERDPSHLRNTYNTEEELLAVVESLNAAYNEAAPKLCQYETYAAENCDVLILAHGVVTRAARAAVDYLREKGVNAGHFRPVTLRPFPGDALRDAAQKAKIVLVAESSLGQMKRLACEAIYGCSTPMEDFFRPGQGITDEDLVKKVLALKY
jgi:2-oxoglutarate ferredoxin oxidoreductase subunit alpha